MKKRDRKQFEKQALIHLDGLYGAAIRFTSQPDQADDLVQETILRAYRFWHTFDGTNCRAWLFRILTNTYFSHHQKVKRQLARDENAGTEQTITDGVLLDEQARVQDGADALEQAQLSEELSQALSKLRTDYRIPVILCDVCGFSYKEMAEILDCPMGTVMSRLYRGRKELQKSLKHLAIEHGLIEPSPSDKLVKLNDYR